MNKEHSLEECGKIHDGLTHEEWLTNEENNTNSEEENTEGNDKELGEIVDYDGSIMSSKIPLDVRKSNITSKSTTDDEKKSAHMKGDSFYYRRFWSESYNGAGLGDNEKIDTMTGDETIEYFQDEYDLPEPKAIEKAEENGKLTDTEKQLDSEKMIVMEKKRIKKIVEKLLTKKKNGKDSDLVEPDEDLVDVGAKEEGSDVLDTVVERKIMSLKRLVESNGLNISEVLKRISK
tara:strand:- start:3011 stop:3709 length:699 start_codon:yes stop_codon:yes gene_type:complete